MPEISQFISPEAIKQQADYLAKMEAIKNSYIAATKESMLLLQSVDKLNVNSKNTAEVQKKLNETVSKSTKVNVDLKNIEVEREKVQKQLRDTLSKNLIAEEKSTVILQKGKIALQEKAKASKNLILAQKAERGSTEQLAAVNRILEQRLRKVNQTTLDGKKKADLLRSAIDKNNKKITEQSSAFVKGKRGIGEYSNGIQDAVRNSGLFGRELAILSRIQATLTTLTNKKTEAQIASTAATSLGTKALKVFKIALLSTGIGALVVGLGALVAFFKSSEEGAAALVKVLSPFKILFGNLKDLAINLGGGLVDAFENPKQAVSDLWDAIKKNLLNRVTGIIDTFRFLGKTIKAALELDWDAVSENAGKAGESIVQVMTGVDDAIGKATKGIKNFADETRKENEQNKKLADERLTLIKQEREFSIKSAKLEVEIQKNRLKLKDEENFTNVERLKFAEIAQQQINEQSKLEDELATKRLKYRQLENSFSTSSQEDLDAEAQLQVELINVQAANTKKLLRIESEKQTIIRKIKIEDQAFDKELQSERESEIEHEEALIDIEIENEQRKQDELLALEIEGYAKRDEEAKKSADNQKKINEDKAREIVEISTAMGDSLGALAIGQIKSFKDFSKEILLIALNTIEKKILLIQAELLATDIASKGFLGIATAAIKIGLIKAAFSTVRGAISAFSKGTDNAPSEGLYGEKGAELMKTTKGEYIYADKPTVFSGQEFKGAKIWNAGETKEIMSGMSNGIVKGRDIDKLINISLAKRYEKGFGEMANEYRKGTKLIVSALNKKQSSYNPRAKKITERTGNTIKHYYDVFK